MTKEEIKTISNSIWRSGFVPDKNKIRQQAREKMRSLIAHDLAGSLFTSKEEQNQFLADCKI